MTTGPENFAVAAWVGDDLVPTVRHMLDARLLECTHLGGEGPAIRALAAEQDVPFLDDARSLARADATATVIMDPSRTLSTEVLQSMMRATADAERPLLSMTPRPGLDHDQLLEASDVFTAGPPPTPMPTFRAIPAGRRLLEAAEAFGPVNAATIEISGPKMNGVLGTRLFDAFDLLSCWFGVPATVQAVPVRSSAPTKSRPDRIFAIVGYPDGRTASIVTGADGGRSHRAATLHGEAGRLHSCNGAVDWSDRDGVQLELEPWKPSTPDDFPNELSDAIHATVTGLVPPQTLETRIRLLAACETTFLSARTGGRESCDSVLQMLGRL
ncbi:MAG: hypothetical protein GY895_03880 [Phycisphaera sp.]|nr:hypothetical protein [Phycisphaera sp.]